MGSRRGTPAIAVQSARILDKQPAFIKRGRSVGRFAVGMRYEREVHEYLSLLALGRPEIEFLQSPWIEFWDRSGKRWCQPDAVLLRREAGTGIIVEVKYQHCSEAWFQLKELYLPVCKRIFPEINFGLVEVVHWHDPSTQFPERYEFTPDPFSVRHSQLVSVHIYNPKRERLRQTGYSRSEGDGEKACGSPAAERAE